MKKVLLLAAIILGTSVMVNAQQPAKTTPAKEVKANKHHKKNKATAEVKTTTTEAKKTEAKK